MGINDWRKRMVFNDLREFIEKAKELGEVQTVEGADWDVELGAISELKAATSDSPLLLFDKIKGYPAGFRVASNPFASSKRTALGLDLPLEASKKDQIIAMRSKLKQGVKLVPPSNFRLRDGVKAIRADTLAAVTW
jgi:UbiD family decarboxylase